MKIFNSLLSFFKTKKEKVNKPEQTIVPKNQYAETVSQLESPKHPLYTLYRVGPSVLTYLYSLDTDILEEIYSPNGLIGPSGYSEESLMNMRDYESFWFTDEEHAQEREKLEKDLLRLAKKYNKIGAYSILGSIQDNVKMQKKYWEYGAEMGNKESMMAYAVLLYRHGELEKGFQWLKKSADSGDDIACFYTGVSYNYGTLSEIDLAKAAHYYLMAIKNEESYYHAYINLAVLLADSGYYHTALKYLKKAKTVFDENKSVWTYFGGVENYMSNEQSLEELLELPYPQRKRRVVLQQHARSLDNIFAIPQRTIAPQVSDRNADDIPEWKPKAGEIDIDARDIAERNAIIPIHEVVPADKVEDFIFVSIPVRITSPEVAGTRRELVFLEKKCHAELNNFIQKHFYQLKAAFKSIGYVFVYLPSHEYSFADFDDLIGSYVADYGNQGFHMGANRESRTEFDYWGTMMPSRQLPDDCAGFLRYIPDEEDSENHEQFEYMLFPYRPGTDWQRAFMTFIDFLRRKPLPESKDESVAALKILPKGSMLVVSEDSKVQIIDSVGENLVSIEMPALSKVMLLLLLAHPEGITLKSLIDYKEELFGYYQKIAKGKANMKNIETLVDPTNNSANEKISRIRSAFTSALSEKYKDDLELFLPMGKRGEAYMINLDRSRVFVRV